MHRDRGKMTSNVSEFLCSFLSEIVTIEVVDLGSPVFWRGEEHLFQGHQVVCSRLISEVAFFCSFLL